MRILAKKRFLFETAGQSFLTEPLVIQDMPDCFAQSLMFRLAAGDGDVQALDTPRKQREAERETPKPARRMARRAAAQTERAAGEET